MMNFVNPGDPITAQAFNTLANSVPNIKQLAPNMGFIAGPDGTLVLNQWNNLMAAPQGDGSRKPFALRWMSHSTTSEKTGEWQIFLPFGCATMDSEPVYPTNDVGTDIDGNATYQWYSIPEPQQADATVTQIGDYFYREWIVYVHFKSFPIMKATTAKKDSDFGEAYKDIAVGSLLEMQWNDSEGTQHYSHKTRQTVFTAQNIDFDPNGTFRLIWKCNGDKKNPESYRLYLTNQFITFGRHQTWIEDDTEITEFTDVYVKIDHSKEDISLSVEKESKGDTKDETYIKILKLDTGSVINDFRDEVRKEMPFVNN